MNKSQSLALVLIQRDIMRHETYLASLQQTKKKIEKEAGIKKTLQ